MNLLNQIQTLHFRADLPPKLLVVEQRFDALQIDDIAAAVRTALAERGLLARLRPGDEVAVGVGSRGIANLAEIVGTAITSLREAGCKPFIFPAMGSHGGATGEGQRGVLARLGITEERVGASIRSTMDVTRIGQLPDGPPLFCDVNALAADHILLINRVKPHPAFSARLESGLAKMTVIGLGKQQGAELMHSYGVPGFRNFLTPAARIVEAETSLLGGLAILENAYDRTAKIVGLSAAEIGSPVEMALLDEARAFMPSLPFAQIDVLVVQRMGKDISGAGMDANVLARRRIPRQPEDMVGPDVAIVAVLDLTPASHGNATGIGLADVTTARLAGQVDWHTTYTNTITGGIFGVRKAALPITMASDRAALEVAVRCCGQQPDAARYVFMRDTLTADALWVSPNLRAEVEAHLRTTVLGECSLNFTSDGIMTKPWAL